MAATQTQEQDGQAERKITPAEQSAELVSRVEGRFAGTSAALVLQKAEQEPGTGDAEKDLGNKITELARAEQTLQDISSKETPYKDLSPADKIRFAEALGKAKFYAHHAFAEPANLAGIQTRWENAVPNLQNNTRAKVERARAVLSGEMNAEAIAKLHQEFKIGSDEARTLQEQLAKAPDLVPSDKERLLANLTSLIEELRGVEGKLEAIAAQKRLPAAGKNERIRSYQTTAAIYQQSRGKLRELLTRLENYGPA